MRPKDIGTRAETAVVAYLKSLHFPHVERRALAGVNDRGDVAGIPGIVIEVKDHGRMELSAWLIEANREAKTADHWRDHLGVVWHKRRGRGSPADWYVTMDGATFAALLKETGR